MTAQPPMDANEITPRKGAKPGPKLTAPQLLLLLDLIARFWQTTTIQAVLRTYPDFPPIDDAVIRYHRRNGGDKLAEAMQARRSQVLTTGLAVKEVRISHYEFLYQTLARDLEKAILPDQRLNIISAMAALLDKIESAVEPKKGALVLPPSSNITNNLLMVSAEAKEQARQLIEQIADNIRHQEAYDRAAEGCLPFDG